ncbi:sugar ABC transporter permease [Streptomyces sp. DSM 44915]|uniref:Sugar ABC transporter permease n=1 Tax=Streptomyces chisholmiae TaxID=3075540 RepID=A0ABU2JQK0_9ACTN|nr:sugar ABC transporter permease [Streptomyces sp. DSM 44915]MDT0267270.1 sugar ABC transporter permease [Streptomyces sp. DSM 44915]
MYAGFVLYPLTQTVRYSFYDWNGIGTATWVGIRNYLTVFDDPQLYGSVLHSFQLVIFFSFIPVALGLLIGALLRGLQEGPFSTVSRTVLFLPQIIPLVGAAIAWRWLYAQDGLVNQALGWVGLDQLSRGWLGDFGTALPAIGLIGCWVATGFCTVLMLSGIARIEPTLYEAAQLDGAGPVREFFAVTLPNLRHEITVALTVTTIAALASFDIVYVATQGGPGYSTMVPGVQIVRLAFTENNVGLASALAVVLLLLVIVVALPIQLLNRKSR